uniref:hypothetical protein n=1 Tax=Jeotgalibaca porci TaxID=1868793 RepID=UPI0035A05046
MEFNLFIIPLTMIITQLLKGYVPNKYVPFLAVLIGLLAGLGYGAYYGGDLFAQAFNGLLYGASSSGLYDIGASQIKRNDV